ncbi:hypothetical protein N7539_002748 [Penicillium diatomitis]|uniref:SCP domain-containing protein n=1 Tax=Penicillium diatomitis TaxID=2819901 RepID=A0A9W9XFA2_9EURO|nr:uncharacterized protein N7539_002748 [Penicillium diatomitis]KAJ5491181.1 hypothetical protein N7539_002748 [Penicillium diatomitis]
MRFTLLLAALAAGCVNAVEKDVYVTDWTTVTVTETVTAPAVTETVLPPQVQLQHVAPTTTVPVVESVVAPSSTSAVEKPVTSSAPAPVETQAAKEPSPAPVQEPAVVTTQAPAPVETAVVSSSAWSTAWTSTLSVAPAATTQAAAPASAPAGNSYQSTVLYNHNVHRSNHSASSLDWSADLESSAKVLASRCVYEHDVSIPGGSIAAGSYGQNIGYGVEASDVGVMITNLMYNDEINYFPQPYGSPNPDMTLFDKWGHFSQIVWKGTTHVGCATVTCPNLGNVDSSMALPFTVCNYYPAGNVGTEYGDNVLAPLRQPSYVA